MDFTPKRGKPFSISEDTIAFIFDVAYYGLDKTLPAVLDWLDTHQKDYPGREDEMADCTWLSTKATKSQLAAIAENLAPELREQAEARECGPAF